LELLNHLMTFMSCRQNSINSIFRRLPDEGDSPRNLIGVSFMQSDCIFTYISKTPTWKCPKVQQSCCLGKSFPCSKKLLYSNTCPGDWNKCVLLTYYPYSSSVIRKWWLESSPYNTITPNPHHLAITTLFILVMKYVYSIIYLFTQIVFILTLFFFFKYWGLKSGSWVC
jgi:hypothetical protein